MSYELLENISTLRFICIHVSDWIVELNGLIRTDAIPELPDTIIRSRQKVISEFKNLCLLNGFEDLHMFLLKNIFHQLGSDTINLIKKSTRISWILPDRIKERIEEVAFRSH